LREAAGDVTGDEGLKREGKLDQAGAATKSAIDDVAERASSTRRSSGEQVSGVAPLLLTPQIETAAAF